MTTSILHLFAPQRAFPVALSAACTLTLLLGCSSTPQSANATGNSVSSVLAAPARITPATVADEVLRADRDFARNAANRPFRDALRAMFRPDVMMPAPPTRVLTGVDAVLGAFATSPDTSARLNWTPIRVGLSSDGAHAYTIGVGTLVRPDGTRGQFKYLSYWIRERDTWRVAAWRRRAVNADVALDSTMLAPHLPERIVTAAVPDASITSMRHDLMAAEQGFSDLAQRIGVGSAFAEMGADDAVNVGPPTLGRFVVGAQAIAASVAGSQPLNAPSTITWKADMALVAPGGDLGITFGVIRPKQPPADNPDAGASFFTIWRKSSRSAPWRYVAE
ncbi:MAG: DUF4440 domain-containing protein [Gemmatimonadaceae bacterium]|nr:DUF4440 domain-containing protein [Gemmatimonadaceae bacterium]